APASTGDTANPTTQTRIAPDTKGYVEIGGNYHHVSDDFGNWFGQYIKGEIQLDPDNRWYGEVLLQREFRDDGYFVSVGNTHTFNEDWYSDLSIGAANDGFFLPQYRVDGYLNRKFLPKRQFVATVGAGFYKAR